MLRILHRFNQSKWQEWIKISNWEIMLELGIKNEKTFRDNRNNLIDLGLIKFVRGSSSQKPSSYKLNMPIRKETVWVIEKSSDLMNNKLHTNMHVDNNEELRTNMYIDSNVDSNVVNNVVRVPKPAPDLGLKAPLKTKNIKYKNKKEKNIKKEKIFSEKSFDELIDDYTQNEKLRCELKEHLKTRKAKRAALTNHAIELSLKKLDTLSGNDEEKIKIVQNAIERGYTSFFELPSNEKRLNPSSGIFREGKPSYDIDEYRKYCRELLVRGRKFEETDVGDNLVCAVKSG
ncbi:MAG: hypothetical protein LBR79_00440 [Oscillospiraceae bacterium]|nr:hypothetical protein [Oscillospiraceae bacterium]